MNCAKVRLLLKLRINIQAYNARAHP